MTRLIKRASAEQRAFRRRRGADAVPADAVAFPDELASADRSMRARPPRFAPVTFSELGGVRFLHFGSEWVQGAMRISRPDRIELEYAQQMMAWLLFLDPPAADARVVQLGLGAAALTKFCYRAFPDSRVEAIELNPSVVVAARSMFALPPDDARLTVTEADAWDIVTAPERRGTIAALQVDVYDATARGPVLDSVAFYRACRQTLREPGMLTVNLFGDHDSYARNLRNLSQAFEGRVVVLPEVHDGNRIALAFAGPALAFPAALLRARAAFIRETWGLPAQRWLRALAAVHPYGDTFEI
ncbi:class I SAM-dependent methyltransferase [Chitinasiproducens palmae]|uniref:Spermidine synthase n=1 Tax=Chitinasiproducens palmae TaxID=1770053 RepID=A0A1H2PVJ1_9BURK|nr:spermidine synthase [Chitinasiproducens palmae]SDV50938.1 Spermidine synthase [Chitinasiproducens palmae]